MRPPALVTAALLFVVAAAPLQGQASTGQAYVVERSHQHARFEANGTGSISVSVRIHVETEAALELFGQLEFDYASVNERVSVDSVTVHKVGGGIVSATASNVQDVSGPVARIEPMYSDLRQKIVTVPGLRPGDTLEYRVTWTTHTPIAPGHFWRSFEFIRYAVVLDEQITVDVPRAKYVQVKTIDADPEVRDVGDRRVYRWRHANPQVDTAAIRRGRLPPQAVYVTTFGSWEELGRWYADLQRDRATPTPRIRAVADSLVRGQRTLLDSIAAVYRYVASEFRYVSLSFGVGRFQPHPAAEVLDNQYGDCKDKHVLLEALLGAIGVRTAPAIISSDTDIEPSVPSPSQFDHMITLVLTGQDSVWLDATPAVAPFRFLLLPLRDKQALVMPPSGAARLVRTPSEPPFSPFDSVAVVGEINDLGGVKAAVTYVLRGDVEVLIRDVLRQVAPEGWTQFANSLAQNAGLIGTASAPHAGNPNATLDPFEFGFRLDRSTPATWLDRRADFWLPLPRIHPPDTAAMDTVELGPPMRHVLHATLQLPPGMTVRLPLPVSANREYADYRATYAITGRTLTARRELRVKRAKVAPPLRDHYASFRRLVLDDEQQSVTLVRATDAPAAALTGNVDDLHARGVSALSNRDAQGAVRLFREVVRLAPGHRTGWTNLGRALMDLRMVEAATDAFRTQVATTPSDAHAHNNLGWALWRSQRLDDAVRAFQRAIELSPLDNYAHASLGRVYLEQDRDSAAAESLERATKVSSHDASLQLDLGKAYVDLKRSDEAVAAFARAVELAPQISTWNTAAYQLALAGIGLDRAAAWGRAAVDAAAVAMRDVQLETTGPQDLTNGFWLSACWDTLGWVYFRQGDLVRAERYVRAAWLLRATGEIGLHLGEIYARQGRKEDARGLYAMAAGAAFPSAEALRRLTAMVGNAERADELIQEARVASLDQRTFKLGKANADLNLTVQVLLTPAGIADVRRSSGALLSGDLARDIRAAKVASLFPDTTKVKIPRQASVICTKGGQCILVLFDFGATPAARIGRDSMLVRERADP